MTTASIRPFYDQWPSYTRRLVDIVREMSPEQLAVRPAPDRWPIWATVGHVAGGRVYWLCGVLGEAGAERTPFTDPLSEVGWEDDETRPRGADELVMALETTWRIIDDCLDRWSPAMLAEPFARTYAGVTRVHTRDSVLQRMFSHEAYHCGELSQTLGMHGLPQIDLWSSD